MMYNKNFDNGINISIPEGTNNLIYVTVNGVTKSAKVITSNEFTFKVNKKSISAINGATGLFNFICECYDTNFLTAYAKVIIEKIMNDFK